MRLAGMTLYVRISIDCLSRSAAMAYGQEKTRFRKLSQNLIKFHHAEPTIFFQ